MNFEVLKTDFKSYLDEQKKISSEISGEEENKSSEIEDRVEKSEFSLFEYADEFKTYLNEKIPDSNNEINAKSVEDVSKMKILNNNKPSEDKGNNEHVILTADVLGLSSADEDKGTVENTQTSEKSETDDVFSNVFNELIKEDKFKNVIDTDSSGEIDEEELKAFAEKIKGLDENEKDVSVNDLLTAAEQIKNDVFNVPDSEDKFTEKEVDDIKSDIKDSQPSSSDRVPSRSNVGGVSNAYANGSYGGNTIPKSYNSSVSAKNPDNMSEEELKKELEKAKNELSLKQNTLSEIINETDSKIKGLKDNVDKTYDAYQEKVKSVDVEMAKQVDELNQKINAKQNDINKKDNDISNKESSVSSVESAYNNAKSSRENLEGILNELKSSGAKDKSINSQVSDVKSQLEAAKKAENSAKIALENEKKDLEKLKQERKELEQGDNGLNKLKEQMSKLEAEIAAKYPEVKQAQENWDKAKETLTTEKASAVDKAKSDVSTAQNHVNDVQKSITEYKNNESTGKYNNQYNEAAGKKLAAAAHNVRGTVGYCLGGVADSLESVYGYGSMPDIMSAYQAADILAADTGIGAHFKEVQVKREDLPNLPAGAIVVWDNNANGGGSNVSPAGKVHGHISIALGNGQESSDHIANQIVNRDATFRVFYPKS